MSALNLTVLIAVSILIVVEFFIIRYRRSIKKFRESIQSGDRVQVRVGGTLITSIVLDRHFNGKSLRVKQFGARKTFIVPTSNTYPL
ncbi:MAG: hypothetical protein M1445_06315 [Bacteroidetes bacterium]|nr:hypothetical protein [Bacteroidota bacterium]